MKTKIRRFSKSVLSVILAMTLIMSTMLIGTLSATAATDAVFAAGETIYVDFSAIANRSDRKGVNVGTNQSNNSFTVPEWYYSSAPSSVIEIKPNSSMDLSKTATAVQLFKAECNGWASVTNRDVESGYEWQSGNNMIIVASDGKSFRWGTYVAPTYSDYYLRSSYNNNFDTAEQMYESSDNSYAYIKKSGNGTFKICLGSENYETSYTGNNIDTENKITSVTHDVDLSSVNDGYGNTNCKISNTSGSFYILLMYPKTAYNSTDNYYVCASTTLPTAATTTQLTTPEIAWQDGDDGNIPPSGSQTLRVTNTSAYSEVSAGVTYTLSNGTTSTDGVFTVTEAGNYTVTVSTTDSAYTTSGASNQLTASAITAKYALEGSITSGGWNGTYEADDLISEYDSANTDSKYVFKKTVTITASNHFRLITTSNNTMYKPEGTSNGNNYDVSASYSYSTKKATTNDDPSNGAFYISSPGTYTIYVDQSETTPSVWVVSESTSHSITNNTTDTHGTVTLNKTSANKDDEVSFDVTPNTGYEIGTVTISGVTTPIPSVSGNTSTYTFTMPDSDVTINATFKKVATTVTYDVVKGVSQDSISMTETAPGSGIFVSSDVINNLDYFTIRKTYGSEVTFAAHNNNYWFNDSSSKVKVNSWNTNYSNNTNIYINNLNSAQYVCYDSKNDQIYLQSTGSGGGTLSDPYFLISNVDNPSNWTESMFHQAKKDSDGKYYITITPAEIKVLAGAYNSNVYFTMASAKSVNNIYFQDSNSPHATTTDESLISVEDKVNSGKKFCRFSISSSSVISVTISYDNKNTFSVIPESSKIDSSVEVIAKDATIRTDGLQSTLHTYGNTYFYTVGSDSSKTYYTEGTTLIKNKMSFTRESQKSVAAVSLDEVKKGTTLHIETQEVKSGYYVAGYVVNGETLALFKQKETPVLDYTIPYDTEANTKIEITPVYFATDSSTCVTFYVEGFDSTVQETWGNTIACYPYYSGTEDTKNAFSCYPGQPMLYKDGKYFIQVPRTFNEKEVVGMTLNNYIWDDVHKTICNKSNAQTYDYDDFVRIADKMEDGKYIADNIIFSFKFRTNHNNFDYNTDDSRVSPSPISYDTFDAGNGWENLTDHNGNLVNIFGTQLFKTTDPRYSAKSKIEDNPTGNEHLLIVSNGYDENYQGFYATEWTIYAYNENAYKKVAQIPSSALVLSYDEVANSTEVSGVENHEYLSQLSSYAPDYAALNIDKYKNLPAYITYEQNDKQKYNNDGNGGNEGYRCDGRWYYSRINDEIISNVKIQYAENLLSDFTDDSFGIDSNVGTTTQAKAYFTNSTAYEKTTCEGKIGQGKFDITTTYNGSEYMFVGWYLEKEGVTTKITNSTNASIEMTGSETYVARYVKVPNGSINISHSLFSNVSDTAKKGAGTLGLQVTLSYNDGTNIFSKPYSYNTSDSSVSTNVIMGDVQSFYNSVKNSVGESNLKTDSFSIKVSLTSNPADNTSLNNAYVENYKDSSQSYLSFNTHSETIANNLGWTAPSLGQSMEVSIPFNKIFNNSTPITNNVEFFSEFETNPISYEITYNFTTRLYGEKQYKQSDEVSVGTDGLISANGTYSFTHDYIMSVAPDESNFMKTFNWDEASITQSYDSTSHKLTVTVNSTQVDRTVYATINLPDGAEAEHIPTAYGGHFTYDNGKFVMAPANNNAGQEFSYWEIKTLEGAFVANCYSQYFNYVGYDNYIVTAVYGDGKNTDIYDKSNTSTTVTFLEYSRNHWNDYDSEKHPHPADAPYGSENFEYDRLYADFALAFNYKGILLNETDVKGLKLGYVLDVTGASTESELKTGILENQDKSSFKINNSNNVLNYSINRTDLDNKNRVECYYGIKNTETNTSYNIKVYSYMIVDGKVTLSEPITICYNGAINK